MKLEVANISWSDVYKDVARIPREFRMNESGRAIPEGAICKVRVAERSALLCMRGQDEHNNPAIHLDERTRSRLGVSVRTTYDFLVEEVGWFGQFTWAWNASDPAYRIAARLGLVSVVLGFVGLILGIWSIWVTLRQ